MTDRELMQMALLKMEYMMNNGEWYKPEEIIEALRARLAQPEPEPVAWLFQNEETGLTECVDTQQVEWGFEKNNPRWQKIAPLYTAPLQREWQSLTDEEITETLKRFGLGERAALAHAIEAKLKAKNG